MSTSVVSVGPSTVSISVVSAGPSLVSISAVDAYKCWRTRRKRSRRAPERTFVPLFPVVYHVRFAAVDNCVFSVLIRPSGAECFGIEPSLCWPAGDYMCTYFERDNYFVAGGLGQIRPAWGPTLVALNCLNLGRKIARFPDGRFGLPNSRSTQREFHREMQHHSFILRTVNEIKDTSQRKAEE